MPHRMLIRDSCQSVSYFTDFISRMLIRMSVKCPHKPLNEVLLAGIWQQLTLPSVVQLQESSLITHK